MSKNRILVIEDDKDIADSIGLNLELSGYDYTIIDDGLEAAKPWLCNRWNLIFWSSLSSSKTAQ